LNNSFLSEDRDDVKPKEETAAVPIKQEEKSPIKSGVKKERSKRENITVRGPYRKYSLLKKKESINYAMKVNDITKAALELGIPVKNLRRWIANGPYRKRGILRRREENSEPNNGKTAQRVDDQLQNRKSSLSEFKTCQVKSKGILAKPYRL
jgi:hypothetical protein